MEKEKDGVWRTIRGRRIFIASGESLGQAMAKSGKFKENGNLSKRDTLRSAKAEESLRKIKNNKKADKNIHSWKKRFATENTIKNRGTHQAFKNQIMQHNEVNENGKTRVERNEPKYSYRDKQELRHEELQKKLAEYNYGRANEDLEKNSKEWENRFNKGKNNFADLDKQRKEIVNRLDNARLKGNVDTQEKHNKIIADYKAKKQSNNKQEERRLIKQGNKYIVARGNDTDKEAIKKYNEDTRRPALMKFAQDNKEQIKKWVNEYDEETNKRAFEKTKRGEGLTAKEYFGFLGQGPKAGEDVVGYSEKAKLASDGNVVKASRFEAYERNPKANQDAILTDDDMYKTEGERRAEEYMKNDTIKNYVEKKKSNKLIKEDKNYNDTKNDILEGFTEDYGYGDTTPEQAFIEQIDSLKTNSKGQQYKSIYEAGKEYAQGANGTMLVYNDDMIDYLKTKGIKANINNAFDKYTDYMAKNIEKMYNEFKKKGK